MVIYETIIFALNFKILLFSKEKIKRIYALNFKILLFSKEKLKRIYA